MQKVEIILDGPEAEKCAEVINDLAHAVMQHYEVEPATVYCGTAPMKQGARDLQFWKFMEKPRVSRDSYRERYNF